MSDRQLTKRQVLGIREGAVFGLRINKNITRHYIVKKVLRNMHLRGVHAVELLVESEETGLQLNFVLAENMEGISMQKT
jgi:hypothetical protein